LECFLKNFSILKKLKSITLNLVQISWNGILRKTNLKDFENIKTFVSKFEDLKFLTNFNIIMQDKKRDIINEGLTWPVLERLYALKNYYYENKYSGKFGRDIYGFLSKWQVNPLKLGKLCESAKGFIQKIDIIDVRIYFESFDRLIGLFSKKAKKEYEVRIETLLLDGVSYLNSFLKLLSKIPSESTLSAVVDVELISPEDFKERFCTFLTENKVKGKISLIFENLRKKLKAEDEINLKTIANKYKLFQYLHISTKRKVVILELGEFPSSQDIE